MKKFLAITLLTIILVVSIFPTLSAQQIVPDSIQRIGKNTTISLVGVLVNGIRVKSGSGVIITKDNDLYYVLTSAHNLRMEELSSEDDLNSFISRLRIVTTVDGEEHSIKDYSRVTHKLSESNNSLGNLDLAILQFESQKDYQTASFLDSTGQTIVKRPDRNRLIDSYPLRGKEIYVAGFPQSSESFRIDTGQFIEFQEPQSQQRCQRQNNSQNNQYSRESPNLCGYRVGYGMIIEAYSARKMDGGMSGSPILDFQGNMLGIYGVRAAVPRSYRLGIDMEIFWESISSSLKEIIQREHSRKLQTSHI